jgi:hypothetical protein
VCLVAGNTNALHRQNAAFLNVTTDGNGKGKVVSVLN